MSFIYNLMPKQYYIIYNGRQVGPMSSRDLLSYGLNPHSQVWCQGMPQWAEAYTIPELMGLINASAGGFQSQNTPPPPDPISISNPQPNNFQPNHNPGQPSYQYNGPSGKSNIAFGLFAIFLGWLGVQYFYIGKTTAGFLSILMLFCTCGLWKIILLIQGIAAICMSQDQFERKYVYSSSTFPIL